MIQVYDWWDSLYVTCRLIGCTPGSAPGQVLGNEYIRVGEYLLAVKALGFYNATNDVLVFYLS